MPTIGIRKSAWDGGTADQRKVVRVFAGAVKIGEPALYQTGGGVQWLIADDWRFDIKAVAYFGKILSLLPQFNVIPNGDDITRARLLTWIDAHGGVTIPSIPEGEDPFDYTYQQNGGPAFGAARAQVPPGLTTVEG